MVRMTLSLAWEKSGVSGKAVIPPEMSSEKAMIGGRIGNYPGLIELYNSHDSRRESRKMSVSQGDPFKHGEKPDTDHVKSLYTEVVSSC